MKYDKNIIEKLKEQIKNNINDFNYNKDIIDKMYKLYKNDVILNKFGAILEIKNNKIVIEHITDFTDNRIYDIIKLLNISIDYIKNKNKTFPNTKLFLFISDTHYYFDESLPLFVIAKPKNSKGILIPDNTFICHRNIKRKCEDWNTVKNKCNNNQISIKDKKNKLFFIGSNTDSGRTNIRQGLYNLSDNKLPLQIEFGHNRNLYEFSQFKYLLNLPGNQPWSYRFKYLFLAKSLVINIDVHQHYKNITPNDTWINFFDIIFEPDLDYINIVYNWYENNDKNNKYEFKKMIKKLKETYLFFNQNRDKYIKMVNNGYSKVNNITNNLVSECIYTLVYYYSKKINDYL